MALIRVQNLSPCFYSLMTSSSFSPFFELVIPILFYRLCHLCYVLLSFIFLVFFPDDALFFLFRICFALIDTGLLFIDSELSWLLCSFSVFYVRIRVVDYVAEKSFSTPCALFLFWLYNEILSNR